MSSKWFVLQGGLLATLAVVLATIPARAGDCRVRYAATPTYQTYTPAYNYYTPYYVAAINVPTYKNFAFGTNDTIAALDAATATNLAMARLLERFAPPPQSQQTHPTLAPQTGQVPGAAPANQPAAAPVQQRQGDGPLDPALLTLVAGKCANCHGGPLDPDRKRMDLTKPELLTRAQWYECYDQTDTAVPPANLPRMPKAVKKGDPVVPLPENERTLFLRAALR